MRRKQAGACAARPARAGAGTLAGAPAGALVGALAGALGLAAAAAAAAEAEVSEAEVAVFIAALEQIGCVIETDAQALEVERRTGFDEATLGKIVSVLIATGRAVIPASMEGLRLTTPGCG